MRLIDADALIKILEFNSWNIDEWELPHEHVSAGLLANALDREIVEEAPTVDAVPVIRCRDCKYWRKTKKQCGYTYLLPQFEADEYCSRAERKEE